MSKNLEKEYKEYILMETPDLWSRIEKELSKHENAARTEKIQEKSEIQSEAVKQQEQSEIQLEAVKPKGQPGIQTEAVKPKGQPEMQSEVVKPKGQPEMQSEVVKLEKQPEMQSDIVKTEILREMTKTECRSDLRNRDRKRNVKRWATAGSLVAAALVVVVVLPFVNGSIKSTEYSADMCAADTAGSTMTEDNIAVKEEFAVDMEADMTPMEGSGAGTTTAEVTEMEADEEMNEMQYAEEEAAAPEQTKVKADVVIIEITAKENGIILYSGETESGEIYIFTIDENTVFIGIEKESEGLQEGNNYCIEIVAEENGYLAVSVEKTQ